MNTNQYGRYQIVSELGKGAMGMVYQAHDPQIDRMIALKVLRQDRVVDHEFVRRFVAEARAIGRLSHPNIVTVFDVGEDHGTIYIAMEFLEGRSLDILIREQTFNPDKIVDVGIQVADALEYAHRQGIIHRDIKPGNIIITPQGHVKVTDFGIARIEGSSGQQMTQMGEILGTPIYMPPEQVAGQPVDGRSDIYALGVVLYELTTGKHPFTGDNLTTLFNAIGNETAVAPSKLNPQISSPLSRLIMKCLSKSPGERFQNGSSLSDALKKCLATQPSFEKPSGLVRQKNRTGMYALVGVGILIVTGILAFFLIPDRESPKVKAIQPTIVQKKPAEAPKRTGKVKKPSEHLSPKTQSPSSKPVATSNNKAIEKPISTKPTRSLKTATSSSPPAESKPKKTTPITTRVPTSQKPNRPAPKQATLDQSTLNVQSAPPGARFYVNGTYKGATPIKVKLPYGKYEVRLQHKKYFGWEAQINLDKPGEIPLRIRLIPED
jgi:serine/threonine-protein kinase